MKKSYWLKGLPIILFVILIGYMTLNFNRRLSLRGEITKARIVAKMVSMDIGEYGYQYDINCSGEECIVNGSCQPSSGVGQPRLEKVILPELLMSSDLISDLNEALIDFESEERPIYVYDHLDSGGEIIITLESSRGEKITVSNGSNASGITPWNTQVSSQWYSQQTVQIGKVFRKIVAFLKPGSCW